MADLSPGQVLITEEGQKYMCRIQTSRHEILADEPEDKGGADLGPNPYELLLASLGSCTAITIRMYAERKQMPLTGVDVTLDHRRIHAEDCEECESEQGYVDRIDKRIALKGDLTDEQRQRLLQIADRCPVHKTLNSEILIKSVLAE